MGIGGAVALLRFKIGESMKIVHFSDYQETNDLNVLDGARWLLIHHSELDDAAAVLFHTELLDILVGVDHRGARIIDGLWQRAVHLILADSTVNRSMNRGFKCEEQELPK